MPTIAETAEFAAFDEATKGHVTSLGFDKLDPLVAVAQAAGKLAAFGTNPDELIRLPKDATGDALAPLYDRLGVPKDAAGYQFDPATPVDVAAQARETAAALKLTPAQATAYVQRQVNAQKTAAEDAQKQSIAAVQAANLQLESTWQGEHDMKQFLASKALETFGWTVDDVAKMAGTNKDVYVKIMTNMAVLGEKMREARLISGEGPGGPGAMTPEQAQAKIAALQADPAFRARWMNDPSPTVRQAAIDELANLQRIVVQARHRAA